MKRLLLLLLCFHVFFAWAGPYDDFVVNGIGYKIISQNPNRVKVNNNVNNSWLDNWSDMSLYVRTVSVAYMGVAVIPDTVEFNGQKYLVSEIGVASFRNSNVTEVHLPSSVHKINYFAFQNCHNLRKVYFPEGLDTISLYAFQHCDSLEDILLPNSLLYVGGAAFYDCPSVKQLNIGTELIYMAEDAFVLANNLQRISYNARNCHTEYLGNFDYPRNIGFSSDAYCRLDIGDSVRIIPENLFFRDNGLRGKVIIPSSVKYIAQSAFYRTGIDTLVFSMGLDSIGESAFQDCNNISVPIVLPASLKRVGPDAFYGNYSYSSPIVLPDGIEYIDEYAFQNSAMIGTITVPASVRYIGEESLPYDTLIIESDSIVLGRWAIDYDGVVYINSLNPPRLEPGLCSVPVYEGVDTICPFPEMPDFCWEEDHLSYWEDVDCQKSIDYGDDLYIFIPCGARSIYCQASPGWQYLCQKSDKNAQDFYDDYGYEGYSVDHVEDFRILEKGYRHEETIQVCGGYAWGSMGYITTSDVYTQTFTASDGCDSVVTLNLTILSAIHDVIIDTTCGSYTWHGTEYTESGTYIYAYQNGSCPCVDTLKLTITQPQHGSETVMACDSFTWHGTTYYANDNPDTLLYEDFSCATVVGTGQCDVSSGTPAADQLPAGWSYYRAVPANGKIMIGRSVESGWIETPVMDFSAYDSVYITFKARSYSSVSPSPSVLSVYVNNHVYTFDDLPGDNQSCDLVSCEIFTPVENFTSIRFESGTSSDMRGRVFLDDICVYPISKQYTYTYTHSDEHACILVDTLHLTLHRCVPPDVDAPVITETRIVHPNTVVLTFNEAVDTVSAVSMNNYVFNNNMTVTSVSVDSNMVFLTVSPSTDYTDTFLLFVQGVMDLFGNVMTTDTIVLGYPAELTVANIAQLRSKMDFSNHEVSVRGDVAYRMMGSAVVTVTASYNNQKCIQDSTGAILVYDANNILGDLDVGDQIRDLTGTLANYFGFLEFIPVLPYGQLEAHSVSVAPRVVNLPQLNDNAFMSSHQAELIELDDVTITSTGDFARLNRYDLSQNSVSSPALFPYFQDVDYIDMPIPTGVVQNIIGVNYATTKIGANFYDFRYYIVPRSSNDISLYQWVSAPSVSDVTDSSAVVEYMVVLGEMLSVLDRGVCWSTIPNPTIADAHTNDSTGTGWFTSRLTGLTSNTTYYVRTYVTSQAGTFYGDEEHFTTLCMPVPVPYRENFDNYVGTSTLATAPIPDCWERVNVGRPSRNTVGIFADSSYATSGDNTLCLYNHYSSIGSSQFGDAYAMLPLLDASLNSLILSFDARMYHSIADDNFSRFEVGVVSDANDPQATFTLVQEIAVTSRTGETFEVPFANVSGTDARIAFRMRMDDLPAGYTADNGYNYAFIDNLLVAANTSCAIPRLYVSGNTATITYSGTNMPSAYELRIGTDVRQTTSATVNMKHLFGLANNTRYTVEVRAICAVGDTSDWSIPTSFTTTLCVTDTVFFEDFDGDNIQMTTTTLFSEQNWRVVGDTTYNDNWNYLSLYASAPRSMHSPVYSTAGHSMLHTPSIPLMFSDNSTGFNHVYLDFDHICKVSQLDEAYILYSVAENLDSEGVPDWNGWRFLNFENSSDIYYGDAADDMATIVQGRFSDNAYADWHSGQMAYSPDNTNWHHEKFDLYPILFSGENGTPRWLRLQFRVNKVSASSSGSELCAGWYLDNLAVTLSDCAIQDTRAPRVTTAAVTDITTSTAVSGGYVLNRGLPFVARGVCWSTSPNPTVDDSHTVDGVDTGAFTSTLADLWSNTTYYVRAYVTNSDGTFYGNEISFRTICEAEALPYYQGFDNYTGSNMSLPDCWERLFTGTSTSYGAGIYANSSYAASGNNSLLLNNYYTTNTTSTSYGDVYALLPKMDGILNDLTLSFEARRNSSTSASYYSRFEVGVVTDPYHPETTFTPVQSVAVTSLTGEHFDISLANYTGADGHIAFRMRRDDIPTDYTYTYGYNFAYIDNVIVPSSSSCAIPRINVTGHTATITYSGTTTPTAYELRIGSETRQTTDTVVDLLQLFGLAYNTPYEVGVRAICGPDSGSDWSFPVTFITTQHPATLPYSQGWEDVTENKQWMFDNSGVTNKWYIGGAVADATGDSALYISNDGGNTHSYNTYYTTNVWAYRDIDFGNNYVL